MGLNQDISELLTWAKGKLICEGEFEAAYAEFQSLQQVVASLQSSYQLFLTELITEGDSHNGDNANVYLDVQVLDENSICLWYSPVTSNELREGLEL